jgi:hypothetical protein
MNDRVVVGGRLLQVRVHKAFGMKLSMISYDTGRKLFVFRQDHQHFNSSVWHLGICSLVKSLRRGGSAVDTKTHWERVYSTKRSDEVSWYQANPAPSLQLLENAGIDSNT